MNIKVHSSELNRMMKTISQCIDPKSQRLANIEIIYDSNLLSVRGSNGQISAVMSTPLLGGDGESFCVDGTMFARVCSMCSGEVTIETDAKNCIVKGAGRTRIPIIQADIPAFERVNGNTCSVRSEVLSRGYSSVSYAISADQNRPVLTGILMESTDDGVRMITIDGFRMAVETIQCETDKFRAIVPGAFIKLVAASTYAGEVVKLQTNGKRIQASTDGMMIACTLLTGDFPDYNRIMPTSYKTESILHADALQSTLKCGSVVNAGNNLVKLIVEENDVKVMSNSEEADYEAEVACITNGEGLKIAFNLKYMMETIASITENEITMHFNSSNSPCIITPKNSSGFRLILPVRVMG